MTQGSRLADYVYEYLWSSTIEGRGPFNVNPKWKYVSRMWNSPRNVYLI